MATRIPIPLGQQRQSTPLGMPAARAPMVAVEDQTGRAVAQFGAAMQQQVDELQKAEANRMLSQAALDIDAFQREKLKTVGPGARGYADSIQQDIEAYTEKVLTSGIHGSGARLLAAGMSDLKARVVVSARDEEFKRTSQYWLDNLKTAGDNVNKLVYQDPSRLSEALAPHLATIQSISDLAPEVRAGLAREAIEKASLAAGYGAIQGGGLDLILSNAPQGAWQAIADEKIAGTPGSTVQQTIAGMSSQSGIDPAYMLAVADIETGGTFDAEAKNPVSSAQGPFQFTDGTWGQYGAGGSKTDPIASTRAAIAFSRDNQRSLMSSLGRRPEPWEMYLAHQQGASGAAALLKADPKKSVAEALSAAGVSNAERAAKDNGMAGMTVGTALDMWANKFNRAYQKHAGPQGRAAYGVPDGSQMPNWWRLLPFESQRTILNAAINQQESSLRVANTQEERAERLLRRQETEIQRQTAMSGDRLYADGGLTPEWIEQNKPLLSAQDYRYFYDRLDDVPERTDPVVFNELSGMIANGEDIRDGARQALGQGALSRGSYDRLISVAEKSGVIPDGAPNPYQQGASAINTALRPSDQFFDPVAADRLYRAQSEFQEWFDKNPGTTSSEARQEAEAIVRSYRFIEMENFTLAAPLPRHVAGGDRFKGFNIEETEAATVSHFLDLHGGNLEQALADPEFKKQAQLIEQWADALELTRAQKEQRSKERNERR